MFFQQIAALAENLDVQVRIMKKGEDLTVSIVPADAAAIKPLTLKGTAAELDEGFLEAISAPLEAASVKDQVAAYKKTVAADLEEKKRAAATEAEKDSEKKEAAADAKPAKKTRASKAKAKEEPEAETPAPAEATETEKPAGSKEAYAPTESEETVPKTEETETVPEEVAVETPPVEAETPASEIVIDALGGTMDGSEVEPETQTPGHTHNERVERFYGKAGPVITEESDPVPVELAEEPDSLPAEAAAAPDPDDSFFAPPPSMHIPIFD